MKKICLLLFIAVTAMLNANAQTMNSDSVIRIARADAKNFKLSDADFQRFRKTGRNPNSDYFKPVAASNSQLLSDSTYVKTYREMAFKRTRKRHTTGHFILIGGAVAVVVIAVIYAATYTSVVTSYN